MCVLIMYIKYSQCNDNVMTFFSILINALVNSSKMLSFLMYADDTTIYFNCEDFPVHNRHIEINRELDKVNT